MSDPKTRTTVLSLKELKRTYVQGSNTLEVLKTINLDVARGEVIALVAPSGTGKSTLLHVAGLLDQPTAGSIYVAGQDVTGAGESVRTRLRREHIGFMYQFHHLLPEFTALENVMMPLRIARMNQREAKQRALALLDRVGLSKRVGHRPGLLSGGEQQRVALCRALANEPDILLADEPTGNLDVDTTNDVFDMILDTVRGQGLGALIATHNPALAQRMDRIVTIDQGVLKSQ